MPNRAHARCPAHVDIATGGSRLAIRVAPTPWFSRDEEMFNVGLRAQNCGGRRQGILEFDVSSKVRSKGRNIVFYSDAEG